MADSKTLIEQAYSAFNKRDIDGALALMTQDVSWPEASEGGKVVGKEVLGPGVEGSVSYSAKPLQTLVTGTSIVNQATIVFDTNPPMNTPTWMNTIDITAPVSQVAALPSTESASGFNVSWSGTDVGAGIQDFTVYVSDNSGPFTAFQTNTTATSATFTGQVGHTYGFYSIARDLVGNAEAAKSAAEATTQVTTDTTPPGDCWCCFTRT